MKPQDTQPIADETPQAAISLRLTVLVAISLLAITFAMAPLMQCSSLCSTETGGQGANAVQLRAVVDQDASQIVYVTVDIKAEGVFSPALKSAPAALGWLQNDDREQGIPPYLDELAEKGYIAIRVPHAPPTYTLSSLVPGNPWANAIEFTYYLPPDAARRTTAVVTPTRVATYETIVNQKYPITDGRSHWEVWWMQGDRFPVPTGTFRLKDSWPQPLEVTFQIDFGAGASALACVGCPVGLLVYNGYTFIGPYSAPLIPFGAPPPPLAFDSHWRCGEASRLQYISPTVRFTHTHGLANYELFTRTYTITASSSQGWAYKYYYAKPGEAGNLAPGMPFQVTIGPGRGWGTPECLRIDAVFTPTIATTSTVRETLTLAATSIVSPEVRADTVSVALAPGYQLNEKGEVGIYLPQILRQ